MFQKNESEKEEEENDICPACLFIIHPSSSGGRPSNFLQETSLPSRGVGAAGGHVPTQRWLQEWARDTVILKYVFASISALAL